MIERPRSKGRYPRVQWLGVECAARRMKLRPLSADNRDSADGHPRCSHGLLPYFDIDVYRTVHAGNDGRQPVSPEFPARIPGSLLSCPLSYVGEQEAKWGLGVSRAYVRRTLLSLVTWTSRYQPPIASLGNKPPLLVLSRVSLSATCVVCLAMEAHLKRCGLVRKSKELSSEKVPTTPEISQP